MTEGQVIYSFILGVSALLAYHVTVQKVDYRTRSIFYTTSFFLTSWVMWFILLAALYLVAFGLMSLLAVAIQAF